MARATSSGSRKTENLKCGECGWDAPSDCGWKVGDTVFHCEGGTGSTKYQGEIHHIGLMLYPLCWKCGRVVGCAKCAGPVDDVLCMSCAVWTTKAGFVEHGAIVNTEEMLRKRKGLVAPQFADYPDDYQRAYIAQHGEVPKPIDPKATFKQLVGVYLR